MEFLKGFKRLKYIKFSYQVLKCLINHTISVLQTFAFLVIIIISSYTHWGYIMIIILQILS